MTKWTRASGTDQCVYLPTAVREKLDQEIERAGFGADHRPLYNRSSAIREALLLWFEKRDREAKG